MHHLVAFGGTDDEFDIDVGLPAAGSSCSALRDPNVSDPTGSTLGFESDNDGRAPRPSPHLPVFSN